MRVIPSEDLKNGILTYQLDEDADLDGDGVSDFDPNAPGVFPCPTASGGFCRSLVPADIQALDPAGIGVNSAMLAYMSLFPVGNDPSQGRDNGLAFTGFRFNAPEATSNNIYTARFDYNLTQSGSHTIFWRGTLGDIKTDLLPGQFPGRAPNSVLLNNSKGFVISYTAQFRPTIINTFRYGYTRLGIEETGSRGDSFRVRSFGNVTSFDRAVARRIPIHEFRDDLNWVHGRHTFGFGGSAHVTRDNRVSDALTFPDFTVNDGFCVNLCTDAFRTLAGDTNASNDPLDRTTFDRAFMMLIGAITQTSATFFVDPKNSTFLPAGTSPRRRFAENGVELYFQDSWHLKSNLTLTFGVRYSYDTPVWETRGAQVRPTVDIRQWWNQRLRAMFDGLPSDSTPLLAFDLAGKANNTAAWWNPDTDNVAPRLAIAWSPNFQNGILHKMFGGSGKSSIRAGAGVYFSRVGGPIAADTDINGSFGLSNSLINGAGDFTMATAPRFSGSCTATGCTGLPALSQFFPVPTSAKFPAVPLSDFTNIGFLVDNRLSTPYSMNFTLSYQREFPKGFVADIGYVGTFGRQLLTKTDFSQSFLFLKDPQSGVNISEAYNKIVDIIGPDPFNPAIQPFDSNGDLDLSALAAVPSIPFFENMLPNLPDFLGFTGTTPTQAFYTLATLFAPDWGDALAFGIDTGVTPGFSAWNTTIDPQQDGLVLYQPQYQALPAWVNWGSSTYHSLQLGLRRNVIRRMTLGANYVFSKSIDNGSAPENADLFSQSGLGSLNGQIPNPLNPRTNRGRSDFDLHHNFNAYWNLVLPFGRGQRFASGASGALNSLIGDWGFAGTWRWRSGFPITVGNGFNFPTNFFLTGPGTLLGKLKTSVTRNDKNGNPNLFRDPDAAKALIGFTRPGGVGSRNILTGPAFFVTDIAVTKSFQMPWNDKHRIQFRWNAYNIFNNVNFSDNSIQALDPDSGSNFGEFFATAGTARRGSPREMEFGLRFEF